MKNIEIDATKRTSNYSSKYDNDSLDNIRINHIDHSKWFKTMDHYPTTVGQINLLILIVDKIGIFREYDLSKTHKMSGDNLNILYAILRITNDAYNKYLDYVVKKIFRDDFKEIFGCSSISHYDLFFDQLTQDIDNFVCSVMISHFPQLNENSINKKFIKYLDTTFKKSFYEKIMKKLAYRVDDEFFKENAVLFSNMIKEFVAYTNETLTDIFMTMKIFLDKIFCTHGCPSQEIINEIISSLKKHFNLKELFEKTCMEIEIYNEQKLDDDLEWDNASDEQIINSELNEINILFKPIGYQVHDNDLSLENNTIMQPFVDNNFVKSTDEIFNVILHILINYRNVPRLMDLNKKITLEDYYAFAMTIQNTCYYSYEDLCSITMSTKQLPDFCPCDVIFRLISRIFNIKIKLFYENLDVVEFDNRTIHNSTDTVVIYKKNTNTYHNLYNPKHTFTPISKSPMTTAAIIKQFNHSIEKINNKSHFKNYQLANQL